MLPSSFISLHVVSSSELAKREHNIGLRTGDAVVEAKRTQWKGTRVESHKLSIALILLYYVPWVAHANQRRVPVHIRRTFCGKMIEEFLRGELLKLIVMPRVLFWTGAHVGLLQPLRRSEFSCQDILYHSRHCCNYNMLWRTFALSSHSANFGFGDHLTP